MRNSSKFLVANERAIYLKLKAVKAGHFNDPIEGFSDEESRFNTGQAMDRYWLNGIQQRDYQRSTNIPFHAHVKGITQAGLKALEVYESVMGE